MPTIYQLTSWLSTAGGGIPPVIGALTAEYRQRQMDCVVAGLADPTGALPAFPEGWPVFAGRIAGPAAFGYSPELARQLRGRVQKDSLIHVHGLWMYPGRLARKLSEATGAARIISPHGMLEPWALQNSRWKKRVAARAFENQNLRTADCLHALCQSEARSMRAYGLKNPICIIPNGIDVPEVSSQKSVVSSHKENGNEFQVSGFNVSDFTSGRKVLLYLGRIHPKKGLANLLRAWASCHSSLVTRHAEWVLAIAGWDQGGHEAELKRLCDELGIAWQDAREHRTSNIEHPTSSGKAESGKQKADFNVSEFQNVSVLFLGPQFGEDKAACYRDCDAFILPSFSEGLPMVVLEAWAHGKPVLMTPECNLPEGFAAGAALRMEPSAEGIARGLQDLFQTPDASLSALGSRGRALVAGKFTWPKVAADMKSVYDWTLGGGPRPECVQTKS